MTSIGVMQPYFIPYLGYFQLIQKSDTFVIHDDAQYVKQSWINRNQLFIGQAVGYYTIPVSSHSHDSKINTLNLSNQHKKHVQSMFSRFENSYRTAPFFEEAKTIFAEVLEIESTNFVEYIVRGLSVVATALNLDFKPIMSSSLEIEPSLRGQEKVIAIAKELKADSYINLPGGRSLYSPREFSNKDLQLFFIEPNLPDFDLGNKSRIPRMSIIDRIAYCGLDEICRTVSSASLARE